MTLPRKRLKHIIWIALLIFVMIALGYLFRKHGSKSIYASVTLQQVSTKVQEITHEKTNVYSDCYQQETQEQIDELKEKGYYTTSNPLLIYNAYGTNTGSVYYYANASKASYIKVRIKVSGVEDYVYTLKNDGTNNLTKEHEYQITGLVSGKKNRVILTFYNKDGKEIEKTYFDYKTPTDDQVPTISETKQGTSTQKMSDGLFAMLGHDMAVNNNIYLYDNYGVDRGKIPLNAYRSDRLLFIDNQMVYSYDYDQIAFTNRLGKVTKTYHIDGYEFHHDFIYDKYNDAIVCLVNDKTKDTIEDVVISVDVKTGTVKKLIDFEDYLTEMRENAVAPETNTYGGTEVDWIHLNSLSIMDDGVMVFSSREQSTIIKVSGLYDEPSVDYLIHGGSVYDGTSYESLLLKQTGDSFTAQAGQHTITYEEDSSLGEGKYYLYMFNNNYGKTSTIPSFDWSLYTGTDLSNDYNTGTKSMYYKYLVDEKEGTYQLVQSIDLPYSGIISSVQDFGNTISFSSGTSRVYGEYDEDGTLIKSFTYVSKKYAYRVMKYDFKGFYYK